MAPSPQELLEFSPAELREKFKALGLESYRADQVLQWVYGKGVYDFKKMTNLSEALRDRIAEHFALRLPEVASRDASAEDLSTKLLMRLAGGEVVEAVFIPAGERRTVCVSSQVGCKFHCAFCASGQAGFFRNLKASEILAQVLRAMDLSKGRKISNIVFMGIGEPFDNYAEVLKAVRILNDPRALGLGARRITISTCGVMPKIEALAEEGLQVELSVSLHGPNDTVRGAIMPVNRAFAVRPLVAVCKRYAKKTGRAVTFEYILIHGVNASEKEARELGRLLKGVLCKVNLIPYNPIEEFPHEAPPYAEIVRFQQILQEAGIRTTVRFSKGRDIQAACGQLRAAHLKNSRA